MDPIFGLPCINESRAMDNARQRNFIADKLLAQKFESLDLAKSSASGRLFSTRSAIKDFRDHLDLNPGGLSKSCPPIQSRRGHSERKWQAGSMTLGEFDKIINEAKDRKISHLPPHQDVQVMSITAKEKNPNSFILKKDNSAVLNTFDSDSSHIIDLDQYERCLPINRQKHAMREAWDRATTDDIHYKRQRFGRTSHTPPTYSPGQKWRERQSSSSESPTSSNVKPTLDKRKRTL